MQKETFTRADGTVMEWEDKPNGLAFMHEGNIVGFAVAAPPKKYEVPAVEKASPGSLPTQMERGIRMLAEHCAKFSRGQWEAFYVPKEVQEWQIYGQLVKFYGSFKIEELGRVEGKKVFRVERFW